MTNQNTRRDILKGSLALAGLTVFGVPEWVLPAPAAGETLVPFTDLPDKINLTPSADRRRSVPIKPRGPAKASLTSKPSN